jgi:hypothetical protein
MGIGASRLLHPLTTTGAAPQRFRSPHLTTMGVLVEQVSRGRLIATTGIYG